MTVAQLERSMSGAEWLEWAAFYEVEYEERARAQRMAKARKGR